MKGNKKILAVALLLLLVAVSFGTYAIYKTNVGGNATVKAAKWVAKVKKGSTEVTTLALTNADFTCGGTQHGKNNTIAPGDTCTATISVDLSGSEVDAVVSAKVETAEVEGLDTDRFTIESNAGTATSIPYAASMTKDITITLTWQGAADDTDALNTKDLAMQGKTFTIPVTITAAQAM